ncbi:MAG: ParA family protein [Bacteroidota bacterium]|nr:ParA family protein [Bacteroidota bacterium]
MIITFATQKGGAGKTTLAIAFANYLSIVKKKKIQVYDFDFQKSFYNKWAEDNEEDVFPKLYDVEIVDEENPVQLEASNISKMKESEDIYLFDLGGTLNYAYSDILIYSDVIVIPFEYSDVSIKSTIVFVNILGMMESQARRIFLQSKFDKGYFYRNKEAVDESFRAYGKLLEKPVYKRNDLQNINTRKLYYYIKNVVEPTFVELIDYINETQEITI